MAIEFKLRELKEDRCVTSPIKKDVTENKYVTELEKNLLNIMQKGASSMVYKDVSKSYKKLKQYDKAIKNLNKAKEFCQFDPEIYYELGINHLLKEETDFARKNFIRTVKLDEENLKAQVQLGISHELLGEDLMAIDIYKTIIEKNPTYLLAYNHLAGLYMELEMFEDAAKLFHHILGFQPEYYRANLGLGLCFDKMEKYSLAVRFYKKYITRKPKSDTAQVLASRIYDIYARLTKKDKNGLCAVK